MGQLDQGCARRGVGREEADAEAEKPVPCPPRCSCPTCLQRSAPAFVFPRVPSSEPSSPHSTYKSKRISTQDFNTTYNPVTLRFPSSLSCSTTYCSSPFRGPMNNSRAICIKAVFLSCHLIIHVTFQPRGFDPLFPHTLQKFMLSFCYLSFLPNLPQISCPQVNCS